MLLKNLNDTQGIFRFLEILSSDSGRRFTLNLITAVDTVRYIPPRNSILTDSCRNDLTENIWRSSLLASFHERRLFRCRMENFHQLWFDATHMMVPAYSARLRSILHRVGCLLILSKVKHSTLTTHLYYLKRLFLELMPYLFQRVDLVRIGRSLPNLVIN